MLFGVELTRRYKNFGITSNALMPGVITTNLFRHMDKNVVAKISTNPHFKTVEQGASTSVWAAVAPELEGKGGLYLENCAISHEVQAEEMAKARAKGFGEGIPTGYLAYALNEENAKKLWTATEEMIERAMKK